MASWSRIGDLFSPLSRNSSPDPGSACGSNSLALEQAPSCMALALFTFNQKLESGIRESLPFSWRQPSTICARFWRTEALERKTNILKCTGMVGMRILIQGVSLLADSLKERKEAFSKRQMINAFLMEHPRRSKAEKRAFSGGKA